jgi:hypothetical protein
VTGDTCYVAGYSTDSLFPGRKVVEHNGVTTFVDTGFGDRTTISGLESIGQFGRQVVVVDDTVGARAVAGFAA